MSFLLRSRVAWNRRIASVDPPTFRRRLTIDAGRPSRLGDLLEPWQEADFRALDPPWLQLAGLEGGWGKAQHAPVSGATAGPSSSVDRAGTVGGANRGTPAAPRPRHPEGLPQPPVHRRAYLERPRGHSKTTDLAVMITWLLAFSIRRVEGIAAAADQEQAALLHRAVDRLLRLNPRLADRLRTTKLEVRNPSSGSRLEVISSDVKSSWGALPDFVICDELCHWADAELWHSLLSSAAKRPNSVLVAISNAGAGRGWHWEVREAARRSPDWYFATLDGPRANWISQSALAEQAALLPPSTYSRLWLNQWQETAGDFVSLAEAEACRDLGRLEQSRGTAGVDYVAAIDFAEKHDYTVGVIVHQEDTRIVVDRMDVVRPEPDRPTPVAWVENWIEQVARAFGQVTFVIDEYQLLAVIQRLEAEYALHRFEFRAGLGNYALASNLRRLILGRRVLWYPGCGRIDVPWGRDDLETELASVVVRETGGGRWRIDHLPDRSHHDDRVFALGAACLYCVRHHAPADWMEVSPPDAEGGIAF